MRLVPVDPIDPPTLRLLYALLDQREPHSWISHAEMPAFDEHSRFVAGRPFKYWYIIERADGEPVGQIQCTDRNELGVEVLKAHRRQGYATLALALFLEQHEPLPAIPAIRRGQWLANVAPSNLISLAFWEKQGFHVRQYTMVKS